MIPPFDLFREEADGTLHWLGAVEDVEAGRTKVRELMAQSPGKYFLFNQTTGDKVHILSDDVNTPIAPPKPQRP